MASIWNLPQGQHECYRLENIFAILYLDLGQHRVSCFCSSHHFLTKAVKHVYNSKKIFFNFRKKEEKNNGTLETAKLL